MRVTLNCHTCEIVKAYEPKNMARLDDGLVEMMVIIDGFKCEHKNHDVRIFTDSMMMCWKEI